MKKRILSMALAAALTFGASQQAMAQTPVQQGVRAGSNTTTVNSTSVTDGDIVSAGRGTTVTVTTATPPAGKVAKVTVTKKEDFTANTATITGDNTVNKNGTTTLTATVTPTYANTVVWTVTAGTGSAEFVTGETTTTATVTSVVNHETGQATATLKGLNPGEVTVTVAATTSTTDTPISAEAKTMTVLNPATITSAPTAVSKVVTNTAMALCSAAGTAENGTMNYAVSTSNTTAPTSGWSTSLPKASSINSTGHYYVWYYAEANEGYANSEKQVTENYVDVVNGASETLNSINNFRYATNNTTNGSHFTLTGTVNGNQYIITRNDSFTITRKNSETIYQVQLYYAQYDAETGMIFTPSCNYSYSRPNDYNLIGTITNNNTGIIGESLSIRMNSNDPDVSNSLKEVVIYYY